MFSLSLQQDRGEIQKERLKFVGWDKDGLIKQKRKGEIIIILLITTIIIIVVVVAVVIQNNHAQCYCSPLTDQCPDSS